MWYILLSYNTNFDFIGHLRWFVWLIYLRDLFSLDRGITANLYLWGESTSPMTRLYATESTTAWLNTQSVNILYALFFKDWVDYSASYFDCCCCCSKSWVRIKLTGLMKNMNQKINFDKEDQKSLKNQFSFVGFRK